MHPLKTSKKSSNAQSLHRSLGLFTAILLVAGAMIGSGVFKKIVPMAQLGLSGGWILTAWIIAGLFCIIGALVITPLASITEDSGGIYEYLRIAFGRFISFLFGWADFTIIGCAAIAALSYIFVHSVNSLWVIPNPMAFAANWNIGGIIYPFQDFGIKIVAIALISLLTWVNYIGVRKSGWANNIITSAKILGVLLVILVGLFYKPTPLAIIPPTATTSGNFISLLFAAMLSAFWAYDGWYNVSYISGEIKNPKKNIPTAIITGIILVILLYLLINYAFINATSLQELAAVNSNTIGAVMVIEKIVGPAGKTAMILLIMVSVLGTLNASILVHSRVIYRMAQEKSFFKSAENIHPRHRTPHKALYFTCCWSCLLVISGSFDMLTDMVVLASFIFFILLAIALIKLKNSKAIQQRVIGYPILPYLFILFSLALIINTLIHSPTQSAIGLFLILIGVPFFLYFQKKYR